MVHELAIRGVRTIAHVRPDSSRLAEWRARFAALGAEADATPWEHDAMRDRLRAIRPDVVFALLGTTRARAREGTGASRRPETYDAIDYGLTSLLLRAVVDAKLRSRFVYLSAIGVREGTRNAYLRARWKMETELRSSGIPFTIARPSFITGDDREESRPAERFAARLANVALAVAGAAGAGMMRDRYRSMTGGELAAALVTVALSPGWENRTLDAAGLRSVLREPVTAGGRP